MCNNNLKKKRKNRVITFFETEWNCSFFLSLSFSSFSMKDIKEESFFFSGRIIPLVLFHVFVDATMLYCSLTSITIYLVDVLFWIAVMLTLYTQRIESIKPVSYSYCCEKWTDYVEQCYFWHSAANCCILFITSWCKSFNKWR